MDELDRTILQTLQHDFPLEANPYEAIAAGLGIDVDVLLERVARLMADGVIRRMGASLNSRKLGFPSTLCSARVPAEKVERAAEFIGAYCEVTHSYLRKGDFNIWFTLIASGEDRIAEILAQIRDEMQLGACDVLNLPMKTTFKLDARFRAR